ncbi:hypothetical protein XENOCAPTIV_010737 [Xenoophorus captivus]|uniref:Uncharacterized protein n=1 Tax=Xenoophorus captivus TaxID=1517983 RepID=A0ABV0R819_9TELE
MARLYNVSHSSDTVVGRIGKLVVVFSRVTSQNWSRNYNIYLVATWMFVFRQCLNYRLTGVTIETFYIPASGAGFLGLRVTALDNFSSGFWASPPQSDCLIILYNNLCNKPCICKYHQSLSL